MSKKINQLPFAGRLKVAFGVIWTLVAHVLEIWLFGLGYYLVVRFDSNNKLINLDNHVTHDFFDSIYFSFISYTSLGYGDVTPKGPVQFMAGTEALVGLVFIAWTASFLYIEMQKHWESNQ